MCFLGFVLTWYLLRPKESFTQILLRHLNTKVGDSSPCNVGLGPCRSWTSPPLTRQVRLLRASCSTSGFWWTCEADTPPKGWQRWSVSNFGKPRRISSHEETWTSSNNMCKSAVKRDKTQRRGRKYASPCITDSVQTVNRHVGASGYPEPLGQ